MKRFLGILQFLTRIPVHKDLGIDEEFHKSLIYFPLVGLVLGALYYGFGFISQLVFNNGITAVIILLSTVVLTGGLHIDGVGDTFDGIYSYRDKDRILEIMKDSRLGTNALLAIVFLLLFKLVFIYSLLETGNLWGIIIMPIYGRMNSFGACYRTKTPREKGMGNLFIGKVTGSLLAITAGYMLMLVFGINYLFTHRVMMNFMLHAALLVIIFIVVRLFIRSIYKKIDGITGDVLGAICELSEVMYLAGLYFIIGITK